MEILSSVWLIWFLLGIGLALLELFMPGFVIIFMALGCWLVALAVLVWPLSLTQQILLFIGGTILSIVFLRSRFMKTFRGSSSDTASAGYDDFPSGVHVSVVKKITPESTGRIRYRGTFWDASAEEEIDEGEIVEIVDFAGSSRQAFFVRKV
ncbi:NfeD family protein [Desulfohalobium retbaense]|uniref:NfeD-like C-terminal domain-containing protein n=1 Tax=Desulfohalobium retbaense (strain ATCC 49708 / DSM 5692 / JCM 16813 / HR100) TaxID=485915 RepID=C8X1Q3_DESRD|nr:NfeD family protein [Desulfohalobium retbaense]ACV68475.1 protein of unknown function DUF107 [Desulfohalobium retbaense DSM 5692]